MPDSLALLEIYFCFRGYCRSLKIKNLNVQKLVGYLYCTRRNLFQDQKTVPKSPKFVSQIYSFNESKNGPINKLVNQSDILIM